MDPATIALIAGTASSFFGPKPKYTEAQKQQLDIAKRLKAYATGVPGSDPQEQAALAQMRGQLGAEQGQQTGQYLGSLPNNARVNTANGLQNLASGQAAERSNLDLSAMMDWLNQRRQAMLGASQAFGAVGPPTTRESNIPQLMGQLAQLYAQNQAQKQGQQGGGGGGGGDASRDTGLNQPDRQTVSSGGAPFPWLQNQPAAQSPPLTPITGQGGALHAGFDPMGGLMAQQQSPMPAFGQGMAAGPQSGAAGVLGGGSDTSASSPLRPMQQGQQPSGLNLQNMGGWDLKQPFTRKRKKMGFA